MIGIANFFLGVAGVIFMFTLGYLIEGIVSQIRSVRKKSDWRAIERLEHELYPNDPKQWTHDREKCLYVPCVHKCKYPL